ncbi:MAG TPA: 1-acyl-sn-glycerol-3-phosphate acyltransferase [Draconibacterium sp.]|nr:1-acyl-sn-glycerol-3-phosphate acyltransferase [Draconibacterium sp.]
MSYEKWSFGYWLLKKYVQLADWLIYNKVIITGLEKIPKNKPIIFAPNHQNALSDPMAILLNTKFQPVWLARADIFKTKTAAAILKFLKIMPVYRMRDGKENLTKNDETFTASVKVLENNFALGLFPEAAHSGKRQMLVHKKAVPRIVFMAEEKSHQNLDIQIIPTGIYYSHYWKFNRNLIVNFGNPIPGNEYLEAFQQNESAATLLLRQRILDEMQPLVLEIKSQKYYNDFENIREIYGKNYLKRKKQNFSTLNHFKSDQELVKKLDALEEKFPEETEKLVQLVKNYVSKIMKLKIRNWLVENPKQNLAKIVFNKLILILGLPVFLFGFIFNAIPFFTIDIITRKKIKDKGFWSTFFLALGIIIFPIFYLIEFFAVSWLIPGFWLKLAFLIAMPLTGKVAFLWYILFRKTVGRGRLLLLKLFSKKEYYQLFKEKELLYKKLDELLPVTHS